jgi:murein DD-endopeptidase MepM/ murein hydrolase activator NlpD
MSIYKFAKGDVVQYVEEKNKADARKKFCTMQGWSITKVKEKPSDKKRYHLFAHMDRNMVKKGDKVIKYVTPIGTVGDGNGQYYAHLHFSISEGLTVVELLEYIKGWSKEKVREYYIDPSSTDFAKMFGRKVDVGNFGYDYLEWTGYGYHPGVDVNGLSGGNTDFGYAFKASCDGEVIYEKRTWFKNGGWGNVIIIEEG